MLHFKRLLLCWCGLFYKSYAIILTLLITIAELTPLL